MPKFKLDYKAYLKRVIILSWFALAICFAIKLFGGDLFTIVLEDNTAKAVFEYVDNHIWANYIVSALYCAVSLRFYALAMAQRISFKTWEKILYIITVLAGTAIKLWSYEWGYLFDIWQMVLFPVVLVCKTPKKLLNVLYGNVALLVFQIVSMYIKDTNAITMYEHILVGLIYSIDVLLMLILYYGYSNLINLKKEVPQNV